MIRPYISLKSLLVSYSLGMLVTFITVLISANRVSHLNIVSAIRDLPEPPRPPSYLRNRLLAPFRSIWEGFQAAFHIRIFRRAESLAFPVPRQPAASGLDGIYKRAANAVVGINSERR